MRSTQLIMMTLLLKAQLLPAASSPSAAVITPSRELPANYDEMVYDCLPSLTATKLVTAKYSAPRPKGQSIDEIVLHDTASAAGKTWTGVQQYLAKPSDRDVSIHYLVGKEQNQIVRMVPENKKAFHVKEAGHNDRSIGIEIFRHAAQKDSEPYTPWQYQAVSQLVYDIMLRYGITYDQVRGHGQLQSNRKDPRGFDWEAFHEELITLDQCAYPYTATIVMP